MLQRILSMCLTAEALFLFLSILPPSIVEHADERFRRLARARSAVSRRAAAAEDA